MRTIARGLVIDHWRREEIERAYLESIAHLPEALAPSTEARALVLEPLEAIARLLDGLKPKVRKAFLLAQCDGLAYKQIAEQMGACMRNTSTGAKLTSYSESFNPNFYSDSAGNPLAPTNGTQWEAGLKYQPPGTDNLFTPSWLRIDQENLATKLPQENFYRAIGAQVADNLKFLGSYTFTDIKYSKSMVSTLSSTDNLIENRHNSPTQAPRHMASVWGDYKFDSRALDGLRLGGGVRYVGYSWADAENTMKVPA